MQTSMERATPYAAQLSAQSAKARAESELEPGIAGAAGGVDRAVTDVLNPLADVLHGALG
jgi:hypothetical protein